MRKAPMAIACMIILLAGSAALLTSPWFIEKSIAWTCGTPTPRCHARMRAMGHVWAQKGDLAQARSWYRRAATAGDVPAMFHLAWSYEEEGGADIVKAMRRISDQKRGTGLATGTADQLLPTAKLDSAMKWYRAAAEKGFAPAMNNLAQLMLYGPAARRDPKESFRWHLAAAQAGNPVAAMNLSISYRTGQGVAPDVELAKRWAIWTVPRANLPGLDPLTLARTHCLGMSLPPETQALIRAAAARGTSVSIVPARLPPNARLSTFEPRVPALGQL